MHTVFDHLNPIENRVLRQANRMIAKRVLQKNNGINIKQPESDFKITSAKLETHN